MARRFCCWDCWLDARRGNSGLSQDLSRFALLCGAVIVAFALLTTLLIMLVADK